MLLTVKVSCKRALGKGRAPRPLPCGGSRKDDRHRRCSGLEYGVDDPERSQSLLFGDRRLSVRRQGVHACLHLVPHPWAQPRDGPPGDWFGTLFSDGGQLKLASAGASCEVHSARSQALHWAWRGPPTPRLMRPLVLRPPSAATAHSSDSMRWTSHTSRCWTGTRGSMYQREPGLAI